MVESFYARKLIPFTVNKMKNIAQFQAFLEQKKLISIVACSCFLETDFKNKIKKHNIK